MQPLQVYTAGTPNGWTVTICLEELKKVNPELKWELHPINIGQNQQKEDWYLKINPNGKIPAIVDPNNADFAVFETSAILLYLEKKYDPNHHLSWPSTDPQADNLRSEVLQWLFFAHGGIAPMQGQAGFFRGQAVGSNNLIPYALKRYIDETKRLYNVLNIRLQDRDYLVGEGRGKYTLADIRAAGWVFCHGLAGIPRKDVPPNVVAWIDRLLENEAFVTGIKQPSEGAIVKNALANRDWVAEMPKLD